MTEDEANDARLAYYLEIGAVSFEGVDESGEIIYSISDRAKELAPELWQSHIDYVDRSLMDLYEKGLAHIEYNEDLEASISLSPEGQKLAKEMGLIEMDLDQDIPND